VLTAEVVWVEIVLVVGFGVVVDTVEVDFDGAPPPPYTAGPGIV
jgi:hypothetical protein